ncbi:MAG: type II secretion system protein GspM, partial [Gammaproteobacteria bacterium]
MNDRLEAWADRIDALSLRERALLLVAAVAILFGVINTLLLTPVARAQQDRTRQIRAIQSQLTVQSQQARNLAAPGHGASDGPRQQQLARLHRQLTVVDGQLQGRLGTLIRPAQAPAVLKTLLRRERGLQLISLDAHREAPLPSPDAHHD